MEKQPKQIKQSSNNEGNSHEIQLRFRNDDLIAFAGRMGVVLNEEQAEELAQIIANGFGNQHDEFIIGIIREYADQNPTTRNESACELADQKSEIDVMSAFADFLDKHNITIPSDERTGEEGEARLYGSVYYNLETKVLDIIESEVSIDAKVNDIMTEFDEVVKSSGISCQVLPSASEKLKKGIMSILEEH